MTTYDAPASAAAPLDRAADVAIPTLARLLFAAILFLYYWQSGLTKLGDGALFGLLTPDFGAYAQIFPRMLEAAGFDPSALPGWTRWVVVLATAVEFALPVAILIGLLTRLAAGGMIVFVLAQSWVDVVGHGLDGADVGAWFDRFPDSLILDQRALWIFLLLVLVLRGAGPLSLDRLIFARGARGALSIGT